MKTRIAVGIRQTNHNETALNAVEAPEPLRLRTRLHDDQRLALRSDVTIDVDGDARTPLLTLR